jgi:hypothetical protein
MLFFVISQQKTASLSVTSSLRSVFGNDKVYHAHWLARDLSEVPVFKPAPYKKQLQAFCSLADRRQPQCVITVTRDPVARFYSDLFQREGTRIDAGEPLEAFWPTAQHILDLNSNYYARQFDPVGIRLREGENGGGPGRTVLLLRLEDLDRTFPRALKRLTGRSVPLIMRNEASTYGSPSSYERLKREFVLPAPVIDGLFSDPVIRHAYTRTELEGFRDSWERRWRVHGRTPQTMLA